MKNNISHLNKINHIYWLPAICFVLHTIEEIPGFAQWVTKHFGPYSTEYFVYTHIPLIWLGLATSYFATTKPHIPAWKILAIAWQFQFGLNAIFHITTSILFSEYSPGLLTAAAINLPLTGYVLYKAIEYKVLTKTQLLFSLLIGTTVAALVIWSLSFK